MPELLILGAAFCWSAGLVMVRGLAGRAPILAINATRILAPALAFLGVVAVTGRGEALLRVPWTNVWAILGSVALGIVAGDLCMLTAIRSIGVARAYALGGTYPLVGVLIAVAFRGESLSLPAAAGVALVVTGGILLSLGPGRGAALPAPAAIPLRRASVAVGLALTTAVLWGVEVNLTKIAVTGVEPLVANALRMPLGALALNAAALLVYRQPAPGRLGGRNTALATVSGLLALFVGSFLYLSGLQQTGAARGVSIAASSPVFALLIGLVVLREFPGWRSAAGVFLVSGGVALITVT